MWRIRERKVKELDRVRCGGFVGLYFLVIFI